MFIKFHFPHRSLLRLELLLPLQSVLLNLSLRLLLGLLQPAVLTCSQRGLKSPRKAAAGWCRQSEQQDFRHVNYSTTTVHDLNGMEHKSGIGFKNTSLQGKNVFFLIKKTE